jgi:hypothetical protein
VGCRGSDGAPVLFIHPTSWNKNSRKLNFRFTGFYEVRRRCRLSLISLKPTLKRWPFAVTRTTEEIRADTI